MPLVLDLFPRLPWELVCNIASFLPTQDFLSLALVNKEHYLYFHEEFVRQHLPCKAGAERDWALLLMYFNALRYDSVELLKQFLAIVDRDRANGRPRLFSPVRRIGRSPHFKKFMITPYQEPLPFLHEAGPLDREPCAHLQFYLAKRFTYIGLATQADAPNVLAHLYNLPKSKAKFLKAPSPNRSDRWYMCIVTIARALSAPDAWQSVKDQALHIAAKAAFPRTTRLLLAKGANPNSRCAPLLPALVDGHEQIDGMEEETAAGAAGAVVQGTTPTQEVWFHPLHREEGDEDSEDYVEHDCPWRTHIYPVQIVVFPAGYKNFPLVTGCDIPHRRLDPDGGLGSADNGGSSINSGMCMDSLAINLGVEEMRRPSRVFRAYRPLHTLLALMSAGGEFEPAAGGQGANGHAHEEACGLNLHVVHGMLAPREDIW
ncbi:hypothetical protein QBC32DRAFT_88367 [Pseudoneurospora amorphoporcata]|uniref:F-box domain-containing protein n=1 Tax=Pseudoneurospora amorphoporcata TaxID=241081 RepID=A0AAN6SID3_9PEZI|nr:hypothetical protein QBC32DRAFT_88367 [Pseudoneurospora amorphoporcata]